MYSSGDRVLVEEAWEDETGAYHDEYATVVAVDGSQLTLEFDDPRVDKFLYGAVYDDLDVQPA